MREKRLDCGTVPPLLGQVKGMRGLLAVAIAACVCLLAASSPAAAGTPSSSIGQLRRERREPRREVARGGARALLARHPADDGARAGSPRSGPQTGRLEAQRASSPRQIRIARRRHPPLPAAARLPAALHLRAGHDELARPRDGRQIARGRAHPGRRLRPDRRLERRRPARGDELADAARARSRATSPRRGRARRGDARRLAGGRAAASSCAAARSRLRRRSSPASARWTPRSSRRSQRTAQAADMRSQALAQRRPPRAVAAAPPPGPLPAAAPAPSPPRRAPDGRRPRGRPNADRRRDRLRPPGPNLDRPSGRLGDRCRRPVRDPARHAHRDSRLRRGDRRGHREASIVGEHDRPLVPDRPRRRTRGAGARSRSPSTRLVALDRPVSERRHGAERSRAMHEARA